MALIPYGQYAICKTDIDAVVEVLRSDWLTQGPTVPKFETALSQYCGTDYAVAVSNGTAALHLSCLALGVGPGDTVWTSPNTFVASANCARYCGADVDFVDIDLQTYNISIDALKKKLAQAEKLGKLPKVVIPVHFAGQSCNMKAIKQLADQYGFKIIEDACHAIGGKYGQHKIGACVYSDISVFSFHPVKNITTAEGGAALTNQSALAEKLNRLRTHGITRDVQSEKHGSWYYEQIDLGFNYRLSDMQAALGLSQLSQLDRFVEERRSKATYYHRAFSHSSVLVPFEKEPGYSAWHLYVVRVDANERKRVFQGLRDAGIGVNVHYIPVHTQPYYQKLGFRVGDFPNAESYYQSAITLPLYPAMTRDQQDYVVDQVHLLLKEKCYE